MHSFMSHEWLSRRVPSCDAFYKKNHSSMTMEEIMAYCEVLDGVDLQSMERADESALGGEHNGVFFTREHLATGLRFVVPAIVK